MFLSLLLVLIIFFSKSLAYNAKEDKINEIENTFDRIEENHKTLKKLFEDAVIKEIPDTNTRLNNEECICVPFYLCDDGNIIKDGSSILASRSSANPCYTIGDTCCEPYLINNTVQETRESKCGYSGEMAFNNSSNDHSVAKFGEFPWTVMILTDELLYKCVGSLIHPQVVLTSAHCVNISESYTVRAGEWDASNKNEPYPHQNEDVKLIIKHPKFNKINLFYDVALLMLENPFELKQNIRTACLANSAPDFTKTFHSECIATGWGMNKPKTPYTRKMKKVQLTLLSHKTCEETCRKTRLGKWFELHQSFVCGLSHNGVDVCTGDGGSPLVCPIPGQPARYQQVGITSWGVSCGEDVPSVFAKISQIKHWIDEQFDALNLCKKYYTVEYYI